MFQYELLLINLQLIFRAVSINIVYPLIRVYHDIVIILQYVPRKGVFEYSS